MKILHQYSNGGYNVSIYSDGTKERVRIDERSPRLPEQFDLKITDWCDAGCAWCHEQSTQSGEHADLSRVLKHIDGLYPGTEVAIGGGDPLSHPGFIGFVRELRLRGLIPNVTINGRHFERHLPFLKQLTGEGSIFGVGVSFFEEMPPWHYRNMVVHMIAGVDDPNKALTGSREHKLLILGYKDHGRGAHYLNVRTQKVQENLKLWYRLIPHISHKHHLSFDNLAIEQMKPQRLMGRKKFEEYYMGEEGEFSMYIDAVTNTYAVSSYSKERFECKPIEEMFRHVRSMKK